MYMMTLHAYYTCIYVCRVIAEGNVTGLLLRPPLWLLQVLLFDLAVLLPVHRYSGAEPASETP